MKPRILPALAVALAFQAHAALDPAELDRAADPCRDFYAYVNAKWLATATIPDDRTTWGTFSAVQRNNEAILMTALDELVKKRPAAGTAERMAVDYYASGLDLEAIEAAGLEPIAPLLAQAAAVKDPASIAAALAKLHAARIRAGFQFDVRPDPREPSRYLPQLIQDGLGLPERDYYFRQDERTAAQRAAYLAHVARILRLAGDDAARARERAEEVLAFETALAKASMTAVEKRDPSKTLNPTPLAQLERQAPGMPWRAYFEVLGARGFDELNVAQPEFIRAVAQAVRERDPAEWRTYLRWQILHAAATKLPKAFSDTDFDFYERELRGRKSVPQRDGYVVEVISGRYGEEPMAEAIGRVFVDRAFSASAKERALELVRNVKAALAERLGTVEWMSEATRARAQQKLAAMNVKIGYPDRWRDYSGAALGDHPFADNWLRAGRFEMRRVLARIGSPVDRDEWWMAPNIVNAYYGTERNEIVFPAGILQPPFFDMAADDASNYGAIGTVIGHEITHGFDDRGRRFDARGRLDDWWSEADARAYVARARHIEEQYGSYEGVDGLRLDGRLTLGENISDVGGVKIAWLALQRALEGKPRGAVQGLTPEQRFFVAFAYIWRAAYRPAYERLIIQTDHHSPARFRVRGALAHMPEFERTFDCRASRTMATRQAEIW